MTNQALRQLLLDKTRPEADPFNFNTTMTPLLFSTFEVTTQAFYRASLSYAIVNLKPIVPGRTLSDPL